ncbi:MAG: DEAD/DEAH box helicase [Acidimicrobiales bacterium]
MGGATLERPPDGGGAVIDAAPADDPPAPDPGSADLAPDPRSADLAPYLGLVERLELGGPIDEATSGLVEDAVRVWARPGFDTFISLPRLRFEPFAHQLQTAERALRRMRGRAILADEVGLGKTIEAGLVLSELRLRGLADRVLVLVPAGLVEQWQEELERKFALPVVVARGAEWSPEARPPGDPVVVASLASARRDPLRRALTGLTWDLVVADEAHRLKQPRSASGRLARALRARHLLLLTATPVENRLDDLFQLVSLVVPGLLGTTAEFRSRHREGGASGVANLAVLQGRLRDVMIRHRRSQVAVLLPRRLAETIRVEPAPEEAELYAAVSERVRREGQGAPPARVLALRSVQRLAGSSPAAVAPTLAKVGWEDLATLAGNISRTEKSRALIELLRRRTAHGEQVIVFTGFRQTLEFLEKVTADAGLASLTYHGSLPRLGKEAAVRGFRDGCPVLLSTEAAGEGRNLQFCHQMVNFDLPWNPMQIEQRLGRLHRIGQEYDVTLANLVSRGTVEDRILSVLEAKINLFELVVGELDMILGRVEDDFDFERAVFDAHLASAHDAELDERLETLGDALSLARTEYLASRDRQDLLVADTEEAS